MLLCAVEVDSVESNTKEKDSVSGLFSRSNEESTAFALKDETETPQIHQINSESKRVLIRHRQAQRATGEKKGVAVVAVRSGG